MKESAKQFMASIDFDHMLYKEEIEASVAHAKMLNAHDMLSDDECSAIVEALGEILNEINRGEIKLCLEIGEDVHECIEELLVRKVGDFGRKIHLARGVNDQVVLDERLFLKRKTESIVNSLTELLDTFEELAEKHTNTIMPGYSHIQRAQPITLGYHLLAYYQMFNRDRNRFMNCIEGMDMIPPDSGALAGTIFDTDRATIMKELGFSSMLPNAMDAVSDRDFAMEFISDCSIAMMHLSRICEELILWSTVEFGFIEFADEFTTGSRTMPHKKNPDVAEIIRGKTGRVYGDMINLLTVFKGLPMSYNRDMQEDKIPVLDAANTLELSLSMFVDVIRTIKINRGNMQRAAKYGYMNAAELAKYLSDKGIERDKVAEIVGKVVMYAINNGKPIDELWLDDLKQFSQLIENDIYDRIDIRNVIDSKKSEGSTSFKSVERQLADIKAAKSRKSRK